MDDAQYAACQADHLQIAAIVIVGIVGWIITHLLREESERNKFRWQIKDSVRIELIKAIRNYMEWLQQVYAMIPTLRRKVEHEAFPATDDERTKQYREINDMFFKQNMDWAVYLEEYELLFPETTECRQELLYATHEITNLLSRMINDFRSFTYYVYPPVPLPLPTPDNARTDIIRQKSKFLNDYKDSEKILLDQEMLMMDLKYHLQNICLGELYNRVLPTRSPTETIGPHVIREKNGQLSVVPSKIKKEAKT